MISYDQPGGPEYAEHLKAELGRIRDMVLSNAPRVAKVGEWPPYIPSESLGERVPAADGKPAPGFDAGIACALDMIPEAKQNLAATLHAAYTKEAVEQVRAEATEMNADSETAWWLSACSVCNEGAVDGSAFMKQLDDFRALADDSEARTKTANATFEKMTHSFEVKDGVPIGTQDGCIQGAYLAGYPFGVRDARDQDGIYFIGTYEPTLGLEDFEWSQELDEQGRTKSGPVFGRCQYVKCANEQELARALEVVKKHLPVPEAASGQE